MTIPAVPPGLSAGKWTVDPAHSEITFTIRHLMSTVRGSFTDFSADIEIADRLPASTARAEIRMASVDTRNDERDAHIRSPDMLDVERHPTMEFAASGAEPATVGRRARNPRYHVDGALTIKGITRPVRLLTEFYGIDVDPWGGIRAGFGATTTISRADFGIEFNIPLQGEKVLLGDTIDIRLDIQAVQAG